MGKRRETAYPVLQKLGHSVFGNLVIARQDVTEVNTTPVQKGEQESREVRSTVQRSHSSPASYTTKKQSVADLVDQLLLEIYGHGSTRRHTSLSSALESDTSGTSCLWARYPDFHSDPTLQRARLSKKGISNLKSLVASLRADVQHAGSLLVRQLKRRDALISRRDKQNDVITAFLQAHSKKRSQDTRIRFSVMPYPGDSGFTQWHDAMKMVARLPGGIPPEFRRRLWLTLAEKHLQARGVDWTHAERFCFNEWSNPDDEELGVQIVKDLHRTGCSLFCGAAAEENQALLKRVLLAFARWNKAVGYCQGFNMLAALILQVMDRCECDAVKVMIYLIEGVLPESYFANNLRGLSVDMAVFRDLLRLRLPALSQHLEQLQHDARDSATGTSYEPPLTNVFTMQWFLTLFSNCLPQPTVLRVWDLIFLEGNEVLLRTALAIWDGLADRIMAVDSADEFYSIMGVLTREMLEFGLMDTNNLIKTIVTIAPFPFPELPELRDKYLYNITPWTHTVSTAARRGLRLFYSDDDDEGTDEDDEKIAVAAAYGIFRSPRRRDSINRAPSPSSTLSAINYAPDRDRLALDISALKQQYTKLKERQRQAHIIFTAACARQPLGPSAPNPVAMNHLLLGKNALLSVRGRRGGPPSGAVPPPANIALRSAPRPCKVKQKEQTITPPNMEIVTPQTQQTLHWKDTKKKQHKLPQEVESGSKQTIDDIPIIVEPETESSSSSSSTTSSSSTSTELCDEPDRLSDFDSEEHSDTSSYLAVSGDQAVSKLQSPDSAPILTSLEEDIPLPEKNITENISDSSELPSTQCLESVLPAAEENILPSECLKSVPSSPINEIFPKDQNVVPNTDILNYCDSPVSVAQSLPHEALSMRSSLSLPINSLPNNVLSTNETLSPKSEISSSHLFEPIYSPVSSPNALNTPQSTLPSASLRTDINPISVTEHVLLTFPSESVASTSPVTEHVILTLPSKSVASTSPVTEHVILTLPSENVASTSSASTPLSPCKTSNASSLESKIKSILPAKDSTTSPIEILSISPLKEHSTGDISSPDLSVTSSQSTGPVTDRSSVIFTPWNAISFSQSPPKDLKSETAFCLPSPIQLQNVTSSSFELLTPQEQVLDFSAVETTSSHVAISPTLQTFSSSLEMQQIPVSSSSSYSCIGVSTSPEKISIPQSPPTLPSSKYQFPVSPSSQHNISETLNNGDIHQECEIIRKNDSKFVQKLKTEVSDIDIKVDLDAAVLNDQVEVLKLLELNQRLHEHERGIRDIAQDQKTCDEKIEVFHDKDVEKLVEMDQQLRFGRRNSERALQIIQENSEILQRILQCQARRPSRLSEEESNGGTLPSELESNVPSISTSLSNERVDVIADQVLESQTSNAIKPVLDNSPIAFPVVDYTIIDKTRNLINGVVDETGTCTSSTAPDSTKIYNYSSCITEAAEDNSSSKPYTLSDTKSVTIGSNKIFTFLSSEPESVSSHYEDKTGEKESNSYVCKEEMPIISEDKDLFEKSNFTLNDDEILDTTTYRTSKSLSGVNRFIAEDDNSSDFLEEKYSSYLSRQKSNANDIPSDLKVSNRDKEVSEEYKSYRSSPSLVDKDIPKYESLSSSWLHEKQNQSDYSKDDNFLSRSSHTTYKYSVDFPKSYDRLSDCDYFTSSSTKIRPYNREFGKNSFEHDSRLYRDYSSSRLSKDAFKLTTTTQNEKHLSDDIYSSPRRRYHFDQTEVVHKARPHSTIISDLSCTEILNRSYSSSSIDGYLSKSRHSTGTVHDDNSKSYLGRSFSPIYETENSSKDRDFSKSCYLDHFASCSKDVSSAAYGSDKQDSESSFAHSSPGASPKRGKDIHMSFPPIKSSTFGSPTRSSSSKFDPFPPRPSTRQPKELGIRLGLYSSTESGKKT